MVAQKEKLTVREYFEQLELEYFSYLFRALVYEEPYFIKMCSDICEKKKVRILKVAHQYQLVSIFKDSGEYQRMLKDVFLQPYGMPAMKYDPSKRSPVVHDRHYAFKKGRQVRYKGEVCVVKENNPNWERIIVVDGKGNETPLRYIDVELLVENLFI